MGDWSPNLSRLGKPRYSPSADAIAEDIRNGRLAPSDRLPPQRKLASRLDIDSRRSRRLCGGTKRGLIESRSDKARSCALSAKRRHGPMARLRKSSTCR